MTETRLSQRPSYLERRFMSIALNFLVFWKNKNYENQNKAELIMTGHEISIIMIKSIFKGKTFQAIPFFMINPEIQDFT